MKAIFPKPHTPIPRFPGRLVRARLVALGAGAILSLSSSPLTKAVEIVRQPSGSVVEIGQPICLSVEALGPSLAYQWWKDGESLPGFTNAALALVSAQEQDRGAYFVVITNQYSSATSDVAILTVNLSVLNNDFGGGANGDVLAVLPEFNDEALIGGRFSSLGGRVIGRLALLHEGTPDLTFVPNPSGSVLALAAQRDGAVLVGGAFTNLCNQSKMYLARLRADGTLDASFAAEADATVYSLVNQPDGKTLVGGRFTTLAGQARSLVGRLNADGTLDTTFSPAITGQIVWTMALQPDGKILFGGYLNPVNDQPRREIGRLNPDGTLDPTFSPFASDGVYALALQADGKILVGGAFGYLNGVQRLRFGRLNADGSLDAAFNPATDAMGTVMSIAVQADGKILAGGAFTNMSGQPRRLIARLNPDGTADTTFGPEALGNWVYGVALQADGQILVGGAFTNLAGRPCSNVGRLANPAAASQGLAYDGMAITWTRGGSTPEVIWTVFEYSADRTNWTTLGQGTRTTPGWQLTATLPADAGTIRARGCLAGGYCNSSTWFVESELFTGTNTISTPAILIDDSAFGFSSNRFGFCLGGPAGQQVTIEGSTNLVNWLPLITNTLGTSKLYFSDPDPTDIQKRFYRLRWTK